MLKFKQLDKKFMLGVIWSVVAISWTVLAGIFFTVEADNVAIITVTAAAVIAEVAVWLSAMLMGIALVDARKSIWNWLRGKKAEA